MPRGNVKASSEAMSADNGSGDAMSGVDVSTDETRFKLQPRLHAAAVVAGCPVSNHLSSEERCHAALKPFRWPPSAKLAFTRVPGLMEEDRMSSAIKNVQRSWL